MRRGHGSSKVPGVKLRPAEAKTAAPSRYDRHSDDDEPSAADVANSRARVSRPFADVQMSASGVENKSELFKLGKELGAACSSALTSLTTHLIAEESGSPKYLVALERGINIVRASWVTESHKSWLAGNQVDVHAMTNGHRLPAFTSRVKICLTEIDDVDERIRAHKQIVKAGGLYSKGFDASVTHLVCGSSCVSEKVEAARKYNQSRSADNKVHIVWAEWLYDCLAFNGTWDPANYSVEQPRPARKEKQSFDPQTSPRREPLPPSLRNELLVGQDETETVTPRQIPQLSSQIWKSVRKTSGPMMPPPSADIATGTVISRVSNAKAAALHRDESDSAPPRMPRQPFSRVSSAMAGPSKLERTTSFAPSFTAQAIFSGKGVYALGAARCDELKKPLVANGARWLDQADDMLSADFILVRLAESATHWQNTTSPALRAIMRTECWVEKCLYDERVCEPDEHASFGPLKVACPISGAQELKVCWSGLGQAEVFWIKRMIKAIGAEVDAEFTKQCNLLLCDTPDGLKSERARKRGVPIVPMQWLFDAAASGQLPSIENVETQPETLDLGDQSGETMADITNDSRSAQFSSLAFESMECDPPAADPMAARRQRHSDTDVPRRPASNPTSSFGEPRLLIQKTASEDQIPRRRQLERVVSISESDNVASPSGSGIFSPESLGTKRMRSDDAVGGKANKRARPVGRGGVARERGSSVVSTGQSTPERAAAAAAAARLYGDAEGEEPNADDYLYKDTVAEAAQQKILKLVGLEESQAESQVDSQVEEPAKTGRGARGKTATRKR